MKAQYCLGCMNELAGQVERCPYCHTVLPYRMQDPNDLPAGMILKKRYLVGRSLGRGGFGATYIARDLKKDKVLTIKEYFPEFACVRNPGSNYVAFKPGTEDKFLSYQKEFKAEAQHLKMLRDIPGVVQFCDYFEAFGTSYLVMTYLEGKTLKDTQLDQHRPFSIPEGVDYTLRTLQVLSRVHGKGILHRDISPDNIFVNVNGQISLIDFGSSSLLSQATMTGFTKGVYTAPEQRINGAQGPATDLYAVGVTLFTLLINHKPKEAEGIHLEEMPEAIPQGIRDVYLKATQREMSQRYQSADEMAKALSLASGVPMPPAPSNRKKKLKNLLLAMMALVAVLVAVMVLAFSGGGSSQPEATPTPVPATATPVVTEAPTPTPTPVPVLPADSWLCRMDGQLYRISPQGMEAIAAGSFPVEENQLQAVELQGLESYQLIYDLDSYEIVHPATGQRISLTSVEDTVTLWLQPGDYALRVTKDDRMLAEGFTVPAQGPVSISAAGEEVLMAWWDEGQKAATVTSAPVAVTPVVTGAPTATPHVHEWKEWLVKEATCVARGELVLECLTCGEEGEHKTTAPLGHELRPATCTEPATCLRCGAKDTAHQPALGHAWQDATCDAPKTCRRCGETQGNAKPHRWRAATCTEPKTCTVCETTTGDPKGHSWSQTSCTEPLVCTVCKATEESTGNHTWRAATCTEPKTCTVCGETQGDAAGHTWKAATCDAAKTCTVCGAKDGRATDHVWQAATCIAPKTCTVCGATEGSTKSHRWRMATCTEPKTCTVCKTTTGEPKGHDMLDATCTEAAVCRRCGATDARQPALGHAPGAAATCTTAQTCTRCRTELKAVLGHQWRDASCASPSTCTVCGATSGSGVGHSWGNWHAKTAATCTTGGTEERFCGNCGQRESRNTEAAGHEYGAWKLVQEATCIDPQISRRICGYCGEQDWHYGTETKAHSYANGVCVWCQMPESGVSMPLPRP